MNDDPLSDRLTVRHSASIQRRIQQLLELKGWTQKEFAQKLGKKEPQVSRMLNKPHNFTLRTIAEMEEVFGAYILNTDPKQFGIKSRTRPLLEEIKYDKEFIEEKWLELESNRRFELSEGLLSIDENTQDTEEEVKELAVIELEESRVIHEDEVDPSYFIEEESSVFVLNENTPFYG